MKKSMVMILAMGLLVAGGCQNKELVQCQQENQAISLELTQTKEKSAIEDENANQMMIEMINSSNELETKLKADLAAKEVALTDAQATLKKTQDNHKADRTKLEQKVMESLQATKKAEALVKELAEKNKQLEDAGNMALGLTEENAKLKEQIAALEKALQEAKTPPAPAQ